MMIYSMLNSIGIIFLAVSVVLLGRIAQRLDKRLSAIEDYLSKTIIARNLEKLLREKVSKINQQENLDAGYQELKIH